MAVPEYKIEGFSIDFLGCTLRVGVILIFKKIREIGQKLVVIFVATE